ncbi:hypothetical protein C2E23DRAFT_448951 [Lenzites betulinus]|nr:hypothetical protein C2E23DRAFT_448951 [Lenzites betulinus]
MTACASWRRPGTYSVLPPTQSACASRRRDLSGSDGGRRCGATASARADVMQCHRRRQVRRSFRHARIHNAPCRPRALPRASICFAVESNVRVRRRAEAFVENEESPGELPTTTGPRRRGARVYCGDVGGVGNDVEARAPVDDDDAGGPIEDGASGQPPLGEIASGVAGDEAWRAVRRSPGSCRARDRVDRVHRCGRPSAL